MKIHTTNYKNTFIEVSEDTKATAGTPPPSKKIKTVAELQYEMMVKNPYRYTSDELIFEIYSIRNDITESEKNSAKIEFFSKGQPCLRTSPLAKTYGFGIHQNEDEKIAIYGMETDEYAKLIADKNVAKIKAMKSAKSSK